jgi:hypothetical protein
MTDALGRVMGFKNKNFNKELRITKKLGVSMLVNNQQFLFDIEATASY